MSILLQIGPGVKGQSLLRGKEMTSSTDPDVMDPSDSADDSKGSYSTPTTYASCFGLPYQDHNYGAPPPPTPPASPSPIQSKVNGHIDIEEIGTTEVVTTTSVPSVPVPVVSPQPVVPSGYQYDNSVVDDSITRCICNFQHDDGYMICCDKCSVWQHVVCMGLDRDNIPDNYLCEKCEPRKVDKSRAIQVQTRKREELQALDTSATDTEDETKQMGLCLPALNLGTKKTVKGRKKKEKEKNSKLEKIKASSRFLKLKMKKSKKEKKEKKKEKTFFKTKKTKDKMKSPKKRIPKVSRLATPITDNISEETKEPWDITSENSVTYEEAKTNRYSPEMMEILAKKQFQFNGSNPEATEPELTVQLLDQLCKVVHINSVRKGLEASVDIKTQHPIIEFRGSVMPRTQYNNKFFKRICPHVLFYKKFENLDICIDANTYGNDARFVRRSCAPNAEVRHTIENGKVHFYIFSQKLITQGAEVTIPFDYSYQDCDFPVECACSKTNCPVARFLRKDENQTKGKKKRGSKSTEERSSIGDESPNLQPVKKKRKTQPLKVSIPNNQQEDIKVSPVKKDEQEQGNQTSVSAPVTSVTTPVVEVEASNSESVDPATESQEEAESRKKMTREERKMEAIMKAFEKLEKREERRKEALARIDTTQKKPVKAEADTGVPEKSVVVENEEDSSTATAVQPKPKNNKGKKRKHGTPARRKSRFNSGASGGNSSATESVLSPDESSVSNTPSTSTPATPMPSDNSNLSTPLSALPPKVFKFPKTKKHLMNEWLNEKSQDLQKPLTINTETVEIKNEETKDFVKCVPSPHASSLNHLRRHSFSGGAPPKQNIAVAPSTPQLDSSMGSAKKRWLRQAMHEGQSPIGAMSPVQSGAMSPLNNASTNSPGGSPPVDFVTPLKKRRLARSSITGECPYPPTPSTPTPPPVGNETFTAIEEEKVHDIPQHVEHFKKRNGYKIALSQRSAEENPCVQFTSHVSEELIKKEEPGEGHVSSCAQKNNKNSGEINLSNSDSQLVVQAPKVEIKDIKTEVVPVHSEQEPTSTESDYSSDHTHRDFEAEPSSSRETVHHVESEKNAAEVKFLEPNVSEPSGSGVHSSSGPSSSISSSMLGRSPSHEPSSIVQSFKDQKLNSSLSSSTSSLSSMDSVKAVDSSESKVTKCQSSASKHSDVSHSEVMLTSEAVAHSSQDERFTDRHQVEEVHVCASSNSENVTETESTLGSVNVLPSQELNVSSQSEAAPQEAAIRERDCEGRDIDSTVVGGNNSNSPRTPRFQESSPVGTADSSDRRKTDTERLGLNPTVGESHSETLNVNLPGTSRDICDARNGNSETVVSCSKSYELEDGEIVDSEESAEEGNLLLKSKSIEMDADSSAARNNSAIPNSNHLNISEVGSRQEISSSSSAPVLPTQESLPESVSGDERNVSEVEPRREQTVNLHVSNSDHVQVTLNKEVVDSTSNVLKKRHLRFLSHDAGAGGDVSSSTSLQHNHFDHRSNSLDSSLVRESQRVESSDSITNKVNEKTENEPSTSVHCGQYESESTSSSQSDSNSEIPTVQQGGNSPGFAGAHLGIHSSSQVTSTSGNSQHTPPVKKKVSLLEYRNRRRQTSRQPASSSSSKQNDHGKAIPGFSSSRSCTNSKEQAGPSSLAPLPLFDQVTTPRRDSRNSHTGHSLSPLPNSLDIKDDQDVRWSSSATSLERILETKTKPISLTERLRKEFGVDAAESGDDEENGKDSEDVAFTQSSIDEPPPPPPPPPPPVHNVLGIQTQIQMGHMVPGTTRPPVPMQNHLPGGSLPVPSSIPTGNAQSMMQGACPLPGAIPSQGGPSIGSRNTGGASIPPLMSLHVPSYPSKPFKKAYGSGSQQSPGQPTRSNSNQAYTAGSSATSHNSTGYNGQTFPLNNSVPPLLPTSQQASYSNVASGYSAPSNSNAATVPASSQNNEQTYKKRTGVHQVKYNHGYPSSSSSF